MDYIQNCNKAICDNIEILSREHRPLLSQNILGQMRNLLDHICVKIYEANGGAMCDKEYQNICNAQAFVWRLGRLHFLKELHDMLQISASHYTFDPDSSERLMLKYYEYLLRIRELMARDFGIHLLHNLEKFPMDTDTSFREFHVAIAEKIETLSMVNAKTYENRFYIEKIKPIFVDGRIYYEVTFTPANDKTSKFDRIIAFTKLDLPSYYAVKLRLVSETISLEGAPMPISVIVGYDVAVRPCEFTNLARIFGYKIPMSVTREYLNLMKFLQLTHLSLTDVMDFNDDDFDWFIETLRQDANTSHLEKLLTICRERIVGRKPGHNVLRYLLRHLPNKVIKRQLFHEPCRIFDGLYLSPQAKPFDRMPYYFSLSQHNPRVSDLLATIPVDGHKHELLARRIKYNCEQEGRLYTDIEELESFGDAEALIREFNDALHPAHAHCTIERYRTYCYIREYENNVYEVISALKDLNNARGVTNYGNTVRAWLSSPLVTIDEDKERVLLSLFADSKVGFIYGAAGTGKSTLINYISHLFSSQSKLYLANTHPAVENLRRRVDAGNAVFMTVAAYLSSQACLLPRDILIIDECSTLSNQDMRAIVQRGNFKLLLLVGDMFQIEAILFGNWFSVAFNAFNGKNCRAVLEKTYRTSNPRLLKVWECVRNVSPDILEFLTKGGFSSRLDNSIFVPADDDEIILTLNYDGLYGINNINKFLQHSNPNEAVQWGVHTYKVGDPVLFNDSYRFSQWLYNNLKGRILDIEVGDDWIDFTVEVATVLNGLEIDGAPFELCEAREANSSVVKFRVQKESDADDDNDREETIVPFQIAYAVSIHKAQGLEYNSVKIVITREAEEQITHNIFYTAITRARDKLKIYWSPETENHVLSSLKQKFNHKDYGILQSKYPCFRKGH